MIKPRDTVRVINKLIERAADQRPRFATVRAIDGTRADLSVGQSKSIQRNCQVMGSAANLSVGQRVEISWSDNGRPVVLAGGGGVSVSISGASTTDADTLDGHDGSWYLNRSNHTGTQTPATISPQGSGSGLDADYVDGHHASAFLSPQYLTLATNANLTNERRLVAGGGIGGVDGGAGGDFTLSVAAGDGLDQSADGLLVDVTDLIGTGLSEDASNNLILAWSGTPTTIQPDDAAAGGSSLYAARVDHRHAIVAAAPGSIIPDDAAAEGASTSFARADHTHAITCAAPAANLSVSSSNSEGVATGFARSDHSHAITSSSNPGAAASLLASAADGGVQLVRLGLGADPDNDNRMTVVDGGQIGQTAGPLLTFDSTNNTLGITGAKVGVGTNTPVADLQSNSDTDQLRLVYASDTGKYAVFYVGSTGSLELDTISNFILDPGANNVNPGGHIEDDLGAYNVMWRTAFLGELYTYNLIAENVMATIGGRIAVAPTTYLTAALDNTNRVANPGFETAGGGGGDLFANWVETVGDGQIADEIILVHSGSHACWMYAGVLANTTITSDNITVTPETTYRLEFWTRGEGLVAGFYAVRDVTNSAWIISKTGTGVPGTTYTKVSVTFIAPAGCTQVTVRFYCPSTQDAFVLFDDAEIILSTITVEHNQPAVNDYLFMAAAPGGVQQIEALQVTAGPTGGGPYVYTVTRDKDGTGANSWDTGAAVINTGYNAGEGSIDLTSTTTIYSHLGPTITIYSRVDGTTWNNVKPVVSLGNLDSFLGYGETYGLAIGNDLSLSAPTDASFKGLTADRDSGVQLFNTNLKLYDSGTPKVQLLAGEGLLMSSGVWGTDTTTFAAVFADDATVTSLDAGDVIIGTPFHSTATAQRGLHWDQSTATLYLKSDSTNYVLFSSNDLKFYSNSTLTIELDGATGDATFGQVAANKFNLMWDASEGDLLLRRNTTAYFQVDGSAGLLKFGSDVSAAITTAIAVMGVDQTYNGEALGAGDLLLGDNSAGKANVLWDRSAGKLLFRGGTTTEAYIDTDGTLTALGGNLKIDSTGLSIVAPAADDPQRSYNFTSGGTQVSGIRAYMSASLNHIRMDGYAQTGHDGLTAVVATAPSGRSASAQLTANAANSCELTVYADSDSKYVYIDGGLTVGSNYPETADGVIGLPEITAPGSAPANSVFIFCRDNGSGKTQLCAIFPSGAVQQIAIEP